MMYRLRCLITSMLSRLPFLDKHPKDLLAQHIHDAMVAGYFVVTKEGGWYVDVTHPAFIASLRNQDNPNGPR